MAYNALQDPGCAALFNTNLKAPLAQFYRPEQVLATMIFGGDGPNFASFGVGRIGLADSAVTVADPKWAIEVSPGVIKYAIVTVMMQNNDQSYGDYHRQTASYNAISLIHELGHVYNLVAGLGGSKILDDGDLPDGSVNPNQDINEKTLQACNPHL